MLSAHQGLNRQQWPYAQVLEAGASKRRMRFDSIHCARSCNPELPQVAVLMSRSVHMQLCMNCLPDAGSVGQVVLEERH